MHYYEEWKIKMKCHSFKKQIFFFGDISNLSPPTLSPHPPFFQSPILPPNKPTPILAQQHAHVYIYCSYFYAYICCSVTTLNIFLHAMSSLSHTPHKHQYFPIFSPRLNTNSMQSFFMIFNSPFFVWVVFILEWRWFFLVRKQKNNASPIAPQQHNSHPNSTKHHIMYISTLHTYISFPHTRIHNKQEWWTCRLFAQKKQTFCRHALVADPLFFFSLSPFFTALPPHATLEFGLYFPVGVVGVRSPIKQQHHFFTRLFFSITLPRLRSTQQQKTTTNAAIHFAQLLFKLRALSPIFTCNQ